MTTRNFLFSCAAVAALFSRTEIMQHRWLALVLLVFVSGCSNPTPVSGENEWRGGATDVRLSDSVFIVKAQLNGFTPAAALKPTITQRAKKIAEQNEFVAFEIERFNVNYFAPDRKFGADARIRFLRQLETEVAGFRYSINSKYLAPYEPKIDALESKSFSKLRSFRLKNSEDILVSLEPAFIDAIGSELHILEGVSETVLHPGSTTFAVYAWVRQGYFGGVGTALMQIKADFLSGKTYNLVGRFATGLLQCWVEDATTHTRVSEITSTPIILR